MLLPHNSIMNTGRSCIHQMHTQTMPVQMNSLSPQRQARFCKVYLCITNCTWSNLRRKYDKSPKISPFSCFGGRNKISASIKSYGGPLTIVRTELILPHSQHSSFPVWPCQPLLDQHGKHLGLNHKKNGIHLPLLGA